MDLINVGPEGTLSHFFLLLYHLLISLFIEKVVVFLLLILLEALNRLLVPLPQFCLILGVVLLGQACILVHEWVAYCWSSEGVIGM